MNAGQPADRTPPLLAGAAELAGFGLRLAVAIADEILIATLRTILDRVDVARLVERVDVNVLLDRMNVDALLDRVDIAGLLDRVDVNALMARLDVDALIDSVNVDAVVSRVDVVGIAEVAIEGVGLPDIIRESTETMATETVGGIRLQTLRADDAVAHLIDRIIRRNGGRAAAPPDQ